MLVSLTHSRWMPKCPPQSAHSMSGINHFKPSDSVYNAVATCKPPNAGHTLWFYLCARHHNYMLYTFCNTRYGAWHGYYKITKYWSVLIL